MKIPRDIQYLIAWHEASHAVAAIAQGNSIEYVTIVVCDGMLGHCKPRMIDKGDPLVHIVAGPVGVELYSQGGGERIDQFREKHCPSPKPDQKPVASDDELAGAVATLKLVKFDGPQIIKPSGAQLHEEYVRAMCRAIDIIRHNWFAVEQITDELMKRKTVSGERAEWIVRHHQRAYCRMIIGAVRAPTNFFQPLDVSSCGAL